jgi:hypothetical protein
MTACTDVVLTAAAGAKQLTTPRRRNRGLSDWHDMIYHVLDVPTLYDSGWCGQAIHAVLKGEKSSDDWCGCSIVPCAVQVVNLDVEVLEQVM